MCLKVSNFTPENFKTIFKKSSKWRKSAIFCQKIFRNISKRPKNGEFGWKFPCEKSYVNFWCPVLFQRWWRVFLAVCQNFSFQPIQKGKNLYCAPRPLIGQFRENAWAEQHSPNALGPFSHKITLFFRSRKKSWKIEKKIWENFFLKNQLKITQRTTSWWRKVKTHPKNLQKIEFSKKKSKKSEKSCKIEEMNRQSWKCRK